ncbi:MAG: hypothetical protein JWQ11_2175 [Rhizobacter sp.]|nr:hypothetical protein [Rhizobacter sp.]
MDHMLRIAGSASIGCFFADAVFGYSIFEHAAIFTFFFTNEKGLTSSM